jgi:hypothetical protein
MKEKLALNTNLQKTKTMTTLGTCDLNSSEVTEVKALLNKIGKGIDIPVPASGDEDMDTSMLLSAERVKTKTEGVVAYNKIRSLILG